jgi:hypothetical protein
MQRSIWYASYESRHFTFEAAGLTEEEARTNLEKGLLAHKQECSLTDDWYEPDDIQVFEMEVGQAYRERVRLKLTGD